MRLRPYFELVRLPNVVASPADSLTGWLVVGGSLASWTRSVPLALASVCLYAAGMALNDLCDVEVDRVERPSRPLPSGRVSTRSAALLSGILLAAGPCFAALTGSSRCVWVALGVAACVVAYDAYFKKSPLGPCVMGLCRGGNLLLGMSLSPNALNASCWIAVASMSVFVAGVTWISRSEVSGGRSRGVGLGVALENIGVMGWGGVMLIRHGFPNVSEDLAQIPLEGLLIVLLNALFVNLAAIRALRDLSPAGLQAAVKTGVRAVAVLDIALVTAVRGPVAALPILAFALSSYALARKFYST